MDIKKLMIISFMLVVLTMGIASASQNATDFMTVDEISQNDDIGEMSPGDIGEVSSDEDSQPSTDENVSVSIEEKVGIDDSESYIAIIDSKDNLNGTLTAVIDDNDTFVQSFNGNETSRYYLRISHLDRIPAVGMHKVNITYQKNGSDVYYSKVANVDFTYRFDVEVSGGPYYFSNGFNIAFFVPADAKGKLNLRFGNKNYSATVKDGYGIFNIPSKDLKVGLANMSCTFLSSTDKYPQRTVNGSYLIEPVVICINQMAVGEKDTLDILSSGGVKVNVELFDRNAGKSLANYSFDSSRFTIEISEFVALGENRFALNFKFGDDALSKNIVIACSENSGDFKASVSAKANFATVKMTGPKIKSNVKIYLDHKLVKSVSLKNGKISYTLSKLSFAKHSVKVLFASNGKFFSKTFQVESKFSLSLKTVKVKKSAKKLTLSATVKTPKKSQKGLKVTFKFNGKKFKAKTNAKGIAKVTVKKSVLKKLKVGKKVKYQVTYVKHTVKKSAKVKR